MGFDAVAAFRLETPVLELIARGSVMYLFLLAGLRILVRRHIGSLGLGDMLLMVLIADAAQNGMAGEYKTVGDGMVLCATLIGWSYLFDWLSFRSPWFARLLEPPALSVVHNGRIIRRHLKAELLTVDELMSQLKQVGVFELADVKRAWIEPDGGVSVLRADGSDSRNDPPQKRRQQTF